MQIDQGGMPWAGNIIEKGMMQENSSARDVNLYMEMPFLLLSLMTGFI
jgi:hypothetical protein